MKSFAICILSQVPLRESPSHQSQMISQLLFGETISILDKQGLWYRIRCDFDQYEAWVEEKQIYLIQDENYQTILANSARTALIGDLFCPIRFLNEQSDIILGMGSSLPLLSQGQVEIQENKYQIDPKQTIIIFTKNLGDRNGLIRTAKKYINTPYLWGGRSIFGIDCSGFTQMIYKMHGYQLDRDASDQAKQGKNRASLVEALAGDLLFFANDKGDIIHTGIYLGDGEIIHASGQVRIDKIDSKGIFRQDKKEYSHQLCSIRHYE